MNEGQAARAVGEDEPLMIAWKAYKETEDYAYTIGWAGKSNEGNLWAAFARGFNAAGGDVK